MKDCFRTFSHTLIARENIWKHASKGDDRPLFKIWHNVRSVSFYVCIVIYIMFLELQPYFQKGGVDRKIGGDFFQVERGGGCNFHIKNKLKFEFRVLWKIRLLKGNSRKTNIEGDCLKGGGGGVGEAWAVFRFKGGLGKKKGVLFLRGNIPMHTCIFSLLLKKAFCFAVLSFWF